VNYSVPTRFNGKAVFDSRYSAIPTMRIFVDWVKPIQLMDKLLSLPIPEIQDSKHE
jgi:hypothetical protein